VIHRDIKPSNILLKNRSGNSVGEVYLVDFGAVQTLATQQGKTVTVVGTYGYMPPEQFGGRAVPASDLYGLGATLIALITKQHPADLPQKDLQIEFEQFTQLSSGFTNWLKSMTHPSLDSRPASVQIAKEVLEKPQQINKQQINKYSLPLSQGKTVDTALFPMAIFFSTLVGPLAVGTWLGIYSTFLFVFMGITFFDNSAVIPFILFLLLGFGNGLIVGMVTRLWFFTPTNPKLHQQVVNAISIVFCTSISIAFFLIMDLKDLEDSSDYVVFVFAPSLIAGLSMGAISKYIARLYQKASER
jgi:serine/threonine protein kinase